MHLRSEATALTLRAPRYTEKTRARQSQDRDQGGATNVKCSAQRHRFWSKPRKAKMWQNQVTTWVTIAN